jgi:hypothetical protein
MVLALLVSCAVASGAAGAEYYVSPKGSDEAPGSAAEPFRTVQRGVRAAKPGDTVFLRAGVYREAARLAASGEEGRPIRLTAYPGERAVLSGTEPIAGPWAVHAGRVYKTTVTHRPRQLFVDGVRMSEARWPNMSYAQRWDDACWRAAAKGTKYGTMVDPALAKTGVDWTGAVATLNIGSWQTFRRVVRSHGKGSDRFSYDRDEESRLAKEKPHRPGFDRYFLAAKLAALDSPGEWFHDGTTLYLWTPDGASPADHVVEGKVRGYAIAADDVSHVELSGLHFFGAGFKLDGVRASRIEGCHLVHPHGLFDPFGPPVRRERHPDEPSLWPSRRWFGETSVVTPTFLRGEDNVLAHCSVRFTNGTSIVVVGTRNAVENCLFHDIDIYGLDTGFGVDLLGTTESSIRYCTLFNMGSSEGIRLANRGKSVVAYNYIHHGGLRQSDGGLVQVATPHARGTEIHHNWVHDHNAFNWGGIGIRGDDKSRGLVVHHNVAWNCHSKGIITKGDENRIVNNTALDNPAIDICVPRDRLPSKVTEIPVQNQHTHTVNNCAPVISGDYPWQIRGGKTGPPLGKVEANYTGKAPLLLDPAKRDFRPRRGSPLVDAGQAIPGITDGFRGTAPDIGAYEFSAPRWVPGYRNQLWVLPDPSGVRLALTMPPLERITVQVEGQGVEGSAATVSFTPKDWARPRPVATGEGRPTRALRFHIPDRGLDETLSPDTLRAIHGRKLTFRSIP